MIRGNRPTDRSLDPGSGLDEEFVSIDGGRRIRVVRAGTGDGPLVVFEAGMGSAASQWNHIQRELSSRYRTIAYDRAGV
ncbi:alpha/beta fold hydrolase, partial [Brevibacterium sediminis]|uniref:alpha/beta fold hydrolase n=1 Tax=Brevibacterium sediminis TaxID=1857024 RepID=UPI003B3AE39E